MSDALDLSDVLGEAAYRLEVSSPGVGRPLSSRDQLWRQVGRLVEVVHRHGTDTGRLTEVGSDALTLEVPAAKKTPARQLTLELDSVQRAIVQVEFKRAEAPAGDNREHHDTRGDDLDAELDDGADAHDPAADTDDSDATSALEGDH